MTRLHNAEHLREHSFNALFGSGSARASYARVDVSTYAYFLLVRVKVSNQTETLRNFRLCPDACDLLIRDGAAQFLQPYGDEFVAGRVTGGELLAILHFEANTAEEKSAIAASVRASGFFFSDSNGFQSSHS